MGLNNNRDPTSLIHFKVDSVKVSRFPPPVTTSFQPRQNLFSAIIYGGDGINKDKIIYLISS